MDNHKMNCGLSWSLDDKSCLTLVTQEMFVSLTSVVLSEMSHQLSNNC